VQKVAEKRLKYKSLCIEMQQMWNMKCMMIPVIIGFKKNLEAIPGKHSVDSLQKAAVPGTSHIIWEVLQSET